MKNLLKIIGFSLVLAPIASPAITLSDVYRDAVTNDPTIKAAEKQWRADLQNVNISWAQLLPQIDAQGSAIRQQNDVSSAVAQAATASGDTQAVVGLDRRFYSNEYQYTIALTQPLFNYNSWASLAGANAFAKQSTANYYAAQQDLIIRTAQAYFNVLTAYENLFFTRGEKKAIGKQLEQTEERFKVGLIPITGVDESRASYDETVAEEIAAQNNLQNRLEELREITGRIYDVFVGIGDKLPLVMPEPKDIEQWVDISKKQNYAVMASKYNVGVAKMNIAAQRAGHFPTLDFTIGYQGSEQTNQNGFGYGHARQGFLGLQGAVNIFSSGGITASVRQAAQLYEQAQYEFERANRSVISGTRQSYLGIESGISKIKADKQAIVSRKSALAATEASYNVGTRTIIDVLDSQTDLYNAQKIHVEDQYNYLLNILLLKQSAGTLGPDDLYEINDWMNKKIAVAKAIK